MLGCRSGGFDGKKNVTKTCVLLQKKVVIVMTKWVFFRTFCSSCRGPDIADFLLLVGSVLKDYENQSKALACN